MNNFVYNIPTKILFGQGQVRNLGKELLPYGNKVLFLYGKNSIKRSGLYDEVIKTLSENGISFVELSGVDPNPRIETVKRGADLCKEHGLQIVLAVGGGSTIDCAKGIALQAKYDGDVWKDFYEDQKYENLKDTLHVASVLTLAATGSEMNGNSVISKLDTNQKLAIGSDKLRPVVSVLDPTYTFTVSKYQTAAGTVDIMSHIFEQYFSPDKGAYLQSRMMESLLKTVIHFGPKAYENPEDYEARANLMWASSLGLNGLLSCGKKNTDWATHMIEHELSAKYDITHGVGLGILTPYWMEYVLSPENVHRFVDYGKSVWKIPGTDSMDIARKSIEMTREFFINLGIPERLREIDIDDSKFEEMAEGATCRGPLGIMKKLEKKDVLEILKMAL